jgi:hypothetical protein
MTRLCRGCGADLLLAPSEAPCYRCGRTPPPGILSSQWFLPTVSGAGLVLFLALLVLFITNRPEPGPDPTNEPEPLAEAPPRPAPSPAKPSPPPRPDVQPSPAPRPVPLAQRTLAQWHKLDKSDRADALAEAFNDWARSRGHEPSMTAEKAERILPLYEGIPLDDPVERYEDRTIADLMATNMDRLMALKKKAQAAEEKPVAEEKPAAEEKPVAEPARPAEPEPAKPSRAASPPSRGSTATMDDLLAAQRFQQGGGVQLYLPGQGYFSRGGYAPGGGPVYVHGYFRRDGKYVPGYYRRR